MAILAQLFASMENGREVRRRDSQIPRGMSGPGRVLPITTVQDRTVHEIRRGRQPTSSCRSPTGRGGHSIVGLTRERTSALRVQAPRHRPYRAFVPAVEAVRQCPVLSGLISSVNPRRARAIAGRRAYAHPAASGFASSWSNAAGYEAS